MYLLFPYLMYVFVSQCFPPPSCLNTLHEGACLVEDVIIALRVSQLHNPRPLKEVGPHSRPRYPTLAVELDLHKLSKPGAVVISDSLGIAKSFQERIRLQDLQGSQDSAHRQMETASSHWYLLVAYLTDLLVKGENATLV